MELCELLLKSTLFAIVASLFCLGASAQTPIYQVAAGSSSYLTQFAPDNYFTGGSTSSESSTGIDASNVSSNAYTPVYQNERNGTFTYTLPKLTAGQAYTLNLLFSEISYTAPNQRQFNVAVNGVTYLKNFDIVAEAGAAYKAIIKSYTVKANSSGQIIVAFTNGSTGLGVPKLSGLEVLTIPTVSSGAATASAGIIYQIGAGSTAAKGSYSADRFYSTTSNTSSTTNSISVTATNNPAPAAVYQTDRYGGAFTYTLPNLVAGQVYTVRLHFAEIYFTQAGQRQFNVAINGATVLTNFDIWAATGASNVAIVKAFPVAANSSGQIIISFSTGSANTPKVSGIELVAGFRIGAGGGGASYWETDQSYLGGSTSQVTYAMDTSEAIDPAPAVVYQSDRYGYITYTLHNLMPGTTYNVRLHFADWVYSTAGQREFDVTLNGAIVLNNYDIIASAGASDTADVYEFLASADNPDAAFIVEQTHGDETVLNSPPHLRIGGSGANDYRHRSAALFDAPAGDFELKYADTGEIVCHIKID